MADEVLIIQPEDLKEGEVRGDTLPEKISKEPIELKESIFPGYYEAVKLIGDIEPGEYVLGSEGPTEVTRAYAHHIPKSMYEIELEDGTKVRVSGNHLWYIETAQDLADHEQRIKRAEKAFSDLCPESWELLEELAKDDSKATMEIEIDDFSRCFLEREREGFMDSFIRVCESVGPVAENFYSGEDVLTGEIEAIGMIKGYDGKRVAQQMLALASKDYRKEFPLIKGRVVDTVTLEQLWDSDTEIPVSEYRNPYLEPGGEWTR